MLSFDIDYKLTENCVKARESVNGLCVRRR